MLYVDLDYPAHDRANGLNGRKSASQYTDNPSRRFPMCDYSLEMYQSRPARAGERYETHRFHSGSIGFVSPGALDVAVCMACDTELELERLPLLAAAGAGRSRKSQGDIRAAGPRARIMTACVCQRGGRSRCSASGRASRPTWSKPATSPSPPRPASLRMQSELGAPKKRRGRRDPPLLACSPVCAD